jgi:hypothetical protein
MVNHITLAQVKKLRHGQTLYTPGYYNADGTTQRWRISGQVKTWKRDPGRVRVPIKHGMYDNWYIDETNYQAFSLIEPPRQKPRR